MSSGNWPFSFSTRSASSCPSLDGPPLPANPLPSDSAISTSSLAADAMASFSDSMSDVNAFFSAFLFPSTSPGSSEDFFSLTVDSNVLACSSPTNLRKGGTNARKWAISARGRKPHKALSEVMAIVISGLWLSSTYILAISKRLQATAATRYTSSHQDSVLGPWREAALPVSCWDELVYSKPC